MSVFLHWNARIMMFCYFYCFSLLIIGQKSELDKDRIRLVAKFRLKAKTSIYLYCGLFAIKISP